MTPELMAALSDHAHGNYRVLTTMAAELLAAAAQREATQLDEKLFFEVFDVPKAQATASKTSTRRAPRKAR